MPRSLISKWRRVATSGKTCDGRTINPQDLLDIAESYDPSVYTAVIWCEHIRYLGNFGSVAQVKAKEVERGKVGLFAKLQPNMRLLEINQRAQKLFTSVEIEPSFADTGKPYLRGLAITDEPASLGTEALHFSRRASTGNHFGSLEPLGDLGPLKSLGDLEVSEEPDDASNSLFGRLFKSRLPNAQANPLSPKLEKYSMNPEKAEAFAAAVEKICSLVVSIENIAQREPSPDASEKEYSKPAEGGAKAISRDSVTLEQLKELEVKHDKLRAEFTTAMNQGRGNYVPNTLGAVTEEMEPLF